MEHPTLFDGAAPEPKGWDLQTASSLAALMRFPGIGSARAIRIARTFRSWESLLNADPNRLRQVVGTDIPRLTDPVLIDDEDTPTRMVGWFDTAYPRRLRGIKSPPAVLWFRGRLPDSEPCIAIVGTRTPTRWGVSMAATMAAEATQAGISVVSGLAFGIDIRAHRSTLNAGGRTIAVLGSGLDHIAPAEHRGDAVSIVAGGGALVSEQPPDTPPSARTLVARNRIQTGLSAATIVVQCGSDSGSLQTAAFALQQNRVLAVPIPPGPDETDAPENQGSIGLTTSPPTVVLRTRSDLRDLLTEIASSQVDASQ